MTPLSCDRATADRAIADAARTLAPVSATPVLDARLLMRHVLGCDETGLILRGRNALGVGEARAFAALIARRLAGTPISRIVGEREFWSLSFEIGPDVLDPRPETETLVEAALDTLAGYGPDPVVCDVGTGSGAIAVALLAERADLTAIATDVSVEALAVATRNATRHGVADRFRPIHTSWLDGVDDPIDLIVSNPPYIRSGDIPSLAPDVRDHDPKLALDGGGDGLDAYRALALAHARRPAPLPGLLMEIGAGQADEVSALLAGQSAAAGQRVVTYSDLAGHTRMVGMLPWDSTGKKGLGIKKRSG